MLQSSKLIFYINGGELNMAGTAKLTEWRKAITMPVIAQVLNNNWSLTELEKILTESFSKCVDVCLEKNGGVICTTLSGGVDSSFCLAKIREIVGRKTPIHALTIVGDERHPDLQFARIAAKKFSAIHHEYIPEKGSAVAAKNFLDFTWPEEPHSDGSAAVFLLYWLINRHGFKCAIACDGIDELFGGYWPHRQGQSPEEKRAIFEKLWGALEKDHLLPLERKAGHFGIDVVLPYLQEKIVNYISEIPLNDRTSFKESKTPLRTIARKYLPKEIIDRKKIGFCDALKIW
ncbi:MAG: asparagine synthase C-terminal domain-containing protein [Candidatus Jorgensenbacteria bacterium]|nr:asparagine synthase C-terminal domain-containing protein [Candidatus Jorgensenbacteria bacterium]